MRWEQVPHPPVGAASCEWRLLGAPGWHVSLTAPAATEDVRGMMDLVAAQIAESGNHPRTMRGPALDFAQERGMRVDWTWRTLMTTYPSFGSDFVVVCEGFEIEIIVR